jgi:hypothetical protein
LPVERGKKEGGEGKKQRREAKKGQGAEEKKV